MPLMSLRAPLALTAILLSSTLPRGAWAQAGPEDEPMPPAIPSRPAPPKTTPPPPATTPPPAAVTPPTTRPPSSAPVTPGPPPAPTDVSPPPSAPVELASPSFGPNDATIMSPSELPAAPAPMSGEAFLPSLIGPIGLYHTSTAEVGPLHQLRLGLHGQFFQSTEFLIQGDTNTRLQGGLTFGFTPHESVEIFGAFLTASNRNQRCGMGSTPDMCIPEPNRRDPELIKSFGDLVLGGKGVLPVSRGFTAGAELGLRFLSSISDLSFSPSSTLFWIGAVASLDLRATSNIPLRFHANANFYLDNSSNLYDFDGTTLQTRAVASFAYGIQQNRVRLALAADAPLERFTAPVPLQPFVEYHAEIVTASADPAFSNGATIGPANRDQQWLTLGLRARVYRALTLDAGVDIGLRSVGYPYGPPLAPWDLIFGLSVPIDLDGVVQPPVVRTVEHVAPPATGTVRGMVRARETASRSPMPSWRSLGNRTRASPRTRMAGSERPAAAWSDRRDHHGRWLRAGEVAGDGRGWRADELEVSLVAKVLTGNLRGRVTDGSGKPVSAALRFAGAATFEAHTDASGHYSAALPAGPYKVSIEAAGLPGRELSVEVPAGQDRQVDVTLRTANPDVTLTPTAIVLHSPIKFSPGEPKLDTTAKRELDGVAELMSDHPEIRKLRIEAHWNGPAGQGPKGGGSGELTRKLTEKQAGAVRDYLVSKGVAAERLEAVGAGGSPVVPNLRSVNRAKNRRVELLVEQ